jgi:hypothetical protein
MVVPIYTPITLGAFGMLIEWWPESRPLILQQLRKGFDSLVLLMLWTP